MVYVPPKRASLPSWYTPVVDEDGRLTPEWYQYMSDHYNYSGMAGLQFPMWGSVSANFIPDDTDPPALQQTAMGAYAYAFLDSSDTVHCTTSLPTNAVNDRRGDISDYSRVRVYVRYFTEGSTGGTFSWYCALSHPRSDGYLTNFFNTDNVDEPTIDGQFGSILSPSDFGSEYFDNAGPGSPVAYQLLLSPDTFAGTVYLIDTGILYRIGPPGTIGPA